MQYKPMRLPCHPVHLVADALALALVAALPLFMPNGYVELIGYKFSLLLRCVLVALLLLPFACLWKNRCKTALRRFSFAWLWPVGLCLCYGAAWFFAEDRFTALWGLSGRKNGLVLYLACTAAYLLIAVAGSPGIVPLVRHTFIATGCAVTVISWLNYWMIDPLDAYYTFLPDRGELFLGTVGNINFYGAFLCLCVPLAAGTYFRQRGRLLDKSYWVALFLCSGLIPAGSDASWLGCFAALLALCCTRKTTTQTLARAAALCAGLAAVALGTGGVAKLIPARVELRTVSAQLASPLVGGILLVVAVLTAYALGKTRPRPAAGAVRVFSLVLLAAAAGALVLANLWPGAPQPLAALRFTERWASNRGYAWQKLWTIYTQDTTLLQKLVGLGGDAVKARLNPDIESTRYMVLLNGEAFDSAHNEFLQHLVCGGALGLLCWCGFCATALVRGFCNDPALAAALLGYFVQSFFSISMPGVLPLVFVLAALAGTASAPAAENNGIRLAAGGTLLFAAAFSLLVIP